jgi:hypothetical protein
MYFIATEYEKRRGRPMVWVNAFRNSFKSRSTFVWTFCIKLLTPSAKTTRWLL